MKAVSTTTEEPNFVNVESIKREKIFPLGKVVFVNPALEQINKAAYWDYQRTRIILRTDPRVKAVVKKSTKNHQKTVEINQTIKLIACLSGSLPIMMGESTLRCRAFCK